MLSRLPCSTTSIQTNWPRRRFNTWMADMIGLTKSRLILAFFENS